MINEKEFCNCANCDLHFIPSKTDVSNFLTGNKIYCKNCKNNRPYNKIKVKHDYDKAEKYVLSLKQNER